MTYRVYSEHRVCPHTGLLIIIKTTLTTYMYMYILRNASIRYLLSESSHQLKKNPGQIPVYVKKIVPCTHTMYSDKCTVIRNRK